MLNSEEFRVNFNAAREIADPVKRETMQRQVFDELYDAISARAEQPGAHSRVVYWFDQV
jgi:hypothetical protein